jgi:outer membrane receptor protein involved in Fe transport
MRYLRFFTVGLLLFLPIKFSGAEEGFVPEDKTPPQETKSSSNTSVDVGNLDQLLNLADKDVGQLSQVKVSGGVQSTNLSAPSNQLDVTPANSGQVSSVGELLRQVPGVNARRTSALNLDPRVRGYNSAQLNATANGMNQLKTRVDIDSLFSQIDPGILDNISVIDGPYTSLYGPGFAFLAADLIAPRRFSQPETHLSTNFVYGSNAQTLYSRDNVVSGSNDWGVILSYGLRNGNDYLTGGGSESFLVPSSYQEWNGFLSTSYDLNKVSRIEFDYIRNDMNNVELPGVVYDINSSVNNQFNLRYIIQEDRDGPRQFVLQSWCDQTNYNGNASRPSKQDSLYQSFFTLPAYFDDPVNTIGRGSLQTLGIRGLRTFGDADSPQWTIGADWRRYHQRYDERNIDPQGNIIFDGNVFGIPSSQMDDIGTLTDLSVPLSDSVTVTVGGRVDYCKAWLNVDDPVITEIDNPDAWFYQPGFSQPSQCLGMAYIMGKIKLSEEYTLKAGTAFAMRMPDLAELYSDEPYVPLVRFGNSYVDGFSVLQPEKNIQLDLGVNYQSKRVAYGVRGFFATIYDYILPVPAYIDPTPPDFIVAPKVLGRNFRYFPPDWRTDLNTPNENCDLCQAGYQYVNLDLATLLGGDLYGEVKLNDWLSVYGNMSYVRGTNESPVCFDASKDSPFSIDGHIIHLGGTDGLPGIYPLNGTIGVRIFQSVEDRWRLDFSARMTRKQDHVAETLDEIAAPGFTIFNLRGYYRVSKNVRLDMEIQNLFNRYYIEPDSLVIIGPNGLPTFLPEPGISAIIGVDARF